MESDSENKSGQRIEKATDVLFKIFWFCFYVVILPIFIAIIGFFIFNFIARDVIIAIGLSVLTFTFSILFFYKFFDRYRKNPFFRNNKNNHTARIHVLFIVTLLSLVVTPIFMFGTPEGYEFELLPLISFCVLYNIVYYYYYFQPIEFFDESSKVFKRIKDLPRIELERSVNEPGITANDAAVAFLGYSHEDFAHMKIFDILSSIPENKSKVEKLYEEFSAKGKIRNQILSVKRKDGEIVWLSISIQMITDSMENISKFQFQFDRIVEPRKTQFHNYIIALNFIIQVIFLAITFETKYSWLFALISNFVFYLIAFSVTRSSRKKIDKAINDNKPFLRELFIYKRGFVNALLGLCAALLIQIPFVIIGFSSVAGVTFTGIEIMNAIMLSIFLLLLYLKVRTYLSFYYNKILEQTLRIGFETLNGELDSSIVKIQKSNFTISILLIGFALFISFFFNAVYLVFILLPIIVIITIYEQKANYCPKNLSRHIYALSLLTLCGSFCFLILPLIPNFGLNFQFLFFLILLLIIFQILIKYDAYKKDHLLILQHLVTVALFIIIAYSIFPFITSIYLDFTPDPAVIIISTILLHAITILIVFLGSLYYFYARYYYKKPTKLLKICFNINILIITSILWILINLKSYYSASFEIFLNSMLFSSILFPALFGIFILLNSSLGILTKYESQIYTYYTCWLLAIVLFGMIAFFSFIYFVHISIILMNILLFFPFASVSSMLLIYFGYKIKKVKESTYQKYRNVVPYVIIIEGFSLQFSLFLLIFQFLPVYESIMLSALISLLLLNLLTIILSNKEILFTKRLNRIISVISLLFINFVISYYIFNAVVNTIYQYNVPLAVCSGLLFLPLLLLKRLKVFTKLIRNLIIINATLFICSLLVFPTVVHVGLMNAGFQVDIITTLNLTIYLLHLILLFLYAVSKPLKIRPSRIKTLVRTQIFLEFGMVVTTAFYYPWLLLMNTSVAYIIPLIIASSFLYIPLFFSFKTGAFNHKMSKSAIIYNTFFFWGCIISMPLIIGFELMKVGFEINFYIIGLITAILVYFFLIFLNRVSKFLKVKQKFHAVTKMVQLVVWFGISILGSISFYVIFALNSADMIYILLLGFTFLIFFILNLFNLYQAKSLAQIAFEFKEANLDMLKIYKFYEIYKNLAYFGLIFTISLLFTVLVQPLYIFFQLTQPEHFLAVIFLNIGTFSLVTFLLLKLTGYIVHFEFKKIKSYSELISWLFFQLTISIFLVLIPLPLFLHVKILFIIAVFTFFSPILYTLLNRTKLISDKTGIILKKLTLSIFAISSAIVFTELLWNRIINDAFISQNLVLTLSVLGCIIFLLGNYLILKITKYFERGSDFRIYRFYGLYLLLLFTLLYFNSVFYFILLLISFIIILLWRNGNLIIRLIEYVVLGYLFFIYLLAVLENMGLLLAFAPIPLGFYASLYMATLSLVLLVSVVMNVKKKNTIEMLLLYGIISGLVFTILFTYTLLPIFYSISIGLFTFSLLIAITLYIKRDPRYKWFIRPCVLLFIFVSISLISFNFMFALPLFAEYNLILSYSLSIGMTTLGYVLLYNVSPQKFRNLSFYIALPLFIISFSIFSYFLLISSFSSPIFNPFFLIISFNIGIVLIYLSIGIFQWKLSRAIWKTGWIVWIAFPLVNFYLIYSLISGIDIYTNAIDFFGIIEINGSFIIAFMICVLLSLPFWYSAIKKHFLIIIFSVWTLNLFLVYWFSQNVFSENIYLTWISFVLFSVLLLIPIFYKYKFWKILSFIWMFFAFINIFFFYYLLEVVLMMPYLINLSINIIIGGLFFIVLSFFPNIKTHKGLILVGAYAVSLIGIFLLVFSILYSIILDLPISINIAFIIIGFTLFTSKILKINPPVMNFLISAILIVNFSLLTFFTFLLIPGFELLSVFLGITVCGGSFFVFNRYKMILPVKKIIPLVILEIGVSGSVIVLLFMVMPIVPYLNIAIFVAVNLVFLYYILGKIRYVLVFIYPLPITLLALQLLILFEFFQQLIYLILLGSILYIFIFQAFINSGKKKEAKAQNLKEEEIKNPDIKAENDNIESSEEHQTTEKVKFEESRLKTFLVVKNRRQIINFVCYVINSTLVSLLITILSPIPFLFQVLEFFITWSILVLLSLRYAEKSIILEKDNVFYKRIRIISSIILFLLYIQIFGFSFGLIFYFSPLTLTETFLISSGILLFLTVLEVFLIKKVGNKVMYPLNLLVYISFTVTLFLYVNDLTVAFPDLFWLNLTILLLVQFYTVEIFFLYLTSFDRWEKEKLVKVKKIVRWGLLNAVFIIVTLYLASLFTTLVRSFNPSISLTTSSAFYIMIFSLGMFLLNLIFNRKISVKQRAPILIILFICFQICLFIYWFNTSVDVYGLTLFSLFSLILLETALSYVPIYLLNSAKPELFSIKKVYSPLLIILYFETALVFFGLSSIYLGIFESLFISQLVLLLVTLPEILLIKKVKASTMYLIHTISYFNISWSLSLFLGLISLPSLTALIWVLLLFVAMQFYTNYAYYATRLKFNEENVESLVKWRFKRQKVIGIIFYIIIFFLIFQGYNSIIPNVYFVVLLTALTFHLIFYLDKYLLKFLGSLTDLLISITWLFVIGSSFLLIINLVILFSIAFIPLIVLIVYLELLYFFKILESRYPIRQNTAKIRRVLTIILYINLTSWPLYFIQLDPFKILNLLVLSILILFLLSFIDNAIHAFAEKSRRSIRKSSFLTIGILLSIDTFLALEFLVNPNIILNLAVSILVFLVFLGVLVNPFKRKKIYSFLYWGAMFFLLSVIVYYMSLSGWSWGIFAFGILLYPFIFMLEELKRLINEFIDILEKLGRAIKAAIVKFFRSVKKFLITHFKVIRIFLCAIVGIFFGVLFSDLILAILNPFHASLLGMAVFGILFGIIPSGKAETVDEAFNQKMKRFITIWVSLTGFVVVLILPYIESVIFSIFLVISSVLGLSAILLIYLYRKEKKEKFSVRWRFYTTIASIVLAVIWVALLLLFYFLEVRV